MIEDEIYDLKYVLSDFMYPRLKAFKSKIDNNEAPTLPAFNDDFPDQNITVEERSRFWSQQLEIMIFPFEYHSYPENFEALSAEEIKEKVQKGLEIFAKYFKDLWI